MKIKYGSALNSYAKQQKLFKKFSKEFIGRYK